MNDDIQRLLDAVPTSIKELQAVAFEAQAMASEAHEFSTLEVVFGNTTGRDSLSDHAASLTTVAAQIFAICSELNGVHRAVEVVKPSTLTKIDPFVLTKMNPRSAQCLVTDDLTNGRKIAANGDEDGLGGISRRGVIGRRPGSRVKRPEGQRSGS